MKNSLCFVHRGTGQTYLELPLLLLDHRPHDVEGRVGEAEHQQQGQLVLDGQDEDVVPVGRVGEARQHHSGLPQHVGRLGLVERVHDCSVHGVLHSQEALSVVAFREPIVISDADLLPV